MHRRARDGVAGRPHGLVHEPAVQALTAMPWQQRRMDVQHAPGETLQRLRSELAHVAGQHDEPCPGIR